MDFKLKECVGTQINSYLEPLAKLRMEVFREWPYLYDGDIEYERNYLQQYAQSENSYTLLVFDCEDLVGATTAIALTDTFDDFKAPLKKLEIHAEDVLYFGESIILQPYRGKKLGHRFFEFRESFARKQNKQICFFCSVSRPFDHPLKPINYRPLHSFWRKMGYQQIDDLSVKFKWKDIDKKTEDDKTLSIWLKNLSW